eukprot:12168508-Alexandrium_andersonii.AAC.1
MRYTHSGSPSRGCRASGGPLLIGVVILDTGRLVETRGVGAAAEGNSVGQHTPERPQHTPRAAEEG